MLNKNQHKVFMTQVLIKIFKSDLSRWLAFKWWTLALLFYGLDRFSTDIDLDLIDPKWEEFVIQNLPKILWDTLEVKNYTLWKDLHRWVCRYDLNWQNIKIEINKRITKHNNYIMQNYFGTDIRIMDKWTMVAHKLCALYERVANRDLRDVNFFLKNMFPINQKIVEERYNMWFYDFLDKLIKEIPKKFSSKTILYVLWNVLDEKQKTWAKKYLVEDTINQIKILKSNL
jgi:predicted nucleotidyltransferase component of viral defense system